MPRKSRFFVGGFIDILSLIAVLFLVVTTVTGAVVINKQNANFDLRNKAMSTEEGGAGGYVAPKTTTTKTTTTTTTPVTQSPVTQTQSQTQTITPPQTTATTPNTPAKANTPSCAVVRLNTAGTCPDGKTIKYVWQNADCTITTDTCTGSQNTPGCTAGTVMNTAGTCPDGKTIKYVRLNADCKTTTTDTCPDSPATQDTQAPAQPETVTPPQTTTSNVLDDTCLEPGQSCQNDNYFDSTCPTTETRCGTKPAQTTSTATNTITTPQTSTTSCSSFGTCYPNTYTCEKSYGQMNCGTGNKCGTHCSAPVSASVPVATSQTLKIYGDTCTGDSQCSSGSCKQKTTALPTKYCVDPNAGLTTTYNALNAVTFGTFGNYVNTYQNINAQNPQASYLGRAFDPTIVPAYNTLNALTFGTFGNYVQTNQNINASNPEASYFERAFNLQNLSASAKLGTVLTAEGAILVAAAPYAVPVLTGANVVDDTATIAQCITGDQNACAWAIPTLLSPVPGTGLADDIFDFTRSWDLLTPNRAPTLRTDLLDSVGSTDDFHFNNAVAMNEPNVNSVLNNQTGEVNVPNIPINSDEVADISVARTFLQQEVPPTTASLPVIPTDRAKVLLSNGANGIDTPGVKYSGVSEVVTIPTSQISGINSSLYSDLGDTNHMSVDSIREIMRNGQWNPTDPRYISDIPLAYELPDGTYFVQSGRHRAVASVLENQPELRVQLYRPIKPVEVVLDTLSPTTVNDLTMPTTARDVPNTENLITPNAQVTTTAENLVISPQIAKDNADLILNPVKNREFVNVRMEESIGGNAGDGYSGVNAAIDNNGNIISFGNIQDLAPEIKTKLNNGELKNITIQVKAWPQVEGPSYKIVYDTDSIPKNVQNNLTLLEEQLNQGTSQVTQTVTKPSFLERTRNTLFGEPKTVNTSKLNQGDTITLFPGDKTSGILTTGESRVPKLSPDLKYYWSTSDDSTIHELTENGITVTTKSGTTAVYIDSDPFVRGGDSPYEIVITTGKDVPIIITRASVEPGIFTLRDSEGNWFPGIRELFAPVGG